MFFYVSEKVTATVYCPYCFTVVYKPTTFCLTVFHRVKHSKFKLGLWETSTGDQSSHHEISGQDVVKNVVEPEEKLAEQSKA